MDFPREHSSSQKIGRFVTYALDGDEPSDMIRTPDPQFKVPVDFDEWDADRRRATIEALLGESVTSWSASDLRKLRSGKLDRLVDQ